MSEIPTTDPDVVALDETGGVLFAWQGCPDVEKLSDLASNRVAEIAIRQASIVRRRDGFVLKSRDGDLGWPADHPLAPATEPIHLERVDLIPPSDELDAVDDHESLPTDTLMRLALWKALMAGEDGFVVVEDRDIIKALDRGQISVERNEKDGLTVFRAHMAGVSTYRVDGEGETDD